MNYPGFFTHRERKSNLQLWSFLILILLPLLLATGCGKKSAADGSLPRSTPDAEGFSAQAILDFIDAAEASGEELHSFMILRHGKVLSEGFWAPYRPELKNTLYSVSKSFTSTAIGFAVNEGLLTVNDKVISFFPEDLPDSISPNLADMEIRDLLCMSAGQQPEPTYSMLATDNWVKSFLAQPVPNVPGTVFLYNSAATYMLSAIISKVTGENVLDYLTPRLFEPLGIEGMDWETDPKGICTGGWGLRIKTEDMAKFGQLYLQKGQWNGKQVVPEAWVDEATSLKIMQHPDMSEEDRSTSDWEQGYCYKFWRSRHNSYRADGAYGQFILILPEYDAVIIMTAEAKDLQKELNLAWDYLLPGFKDGPVSNDQEVLARLEEKIKKLSVKIPQNEAGADFNKLIDGHTYAFIPEGEGEPQSYAFLFGENKCYMTKTTSAGKSIPYTYGSGSWTDGENVSYGPRLLAQPGADTSVSVSFAVAGAYSWSADTTLTLALRYIESPHTEYQLFHFSGQKVTLEKWNSRTGRDNHTLSEGKLAE
ncbi:MAG: serine hydrolase domain-containing protein [Bacteroidota bacterium]